MIPGFERALTLDDIGRAYNVALSFYASVGHPFIRLSCRFDKAVLKLSIPCTG